MAEGEGKYQANKDDVGLRIHAAYWDQTGEGEGQQQPQYRHNASVAEPGLIILYLDYSNNNKHENNK